MIETMQLQFVGIVSMFLFAWDYLFNTRYSTKIIKICKLDLRVSDLHCIIWHVAQVIH